MDSLLRNRRSRRETFLTGGYMERRARPSWHMDVNLHDIAYRTNDMERRARLSLHEAADQEDLDNQAFGFLNRDHVDRIVERKKRIRKNFEMFQLINDYFNKSAVTSNFFTVLVTSLKKAYEFVDLAIKSFEAANKDDQPPEVKRKMRYTKTLDELRQYFSVGGTSEFESIYLYQQQLSILSELQNQKVEQENKLKSVKLWRNVSCINFISALKASPRISATMAGAALIPLGSMRKWFNSMLKDYQDALKAEMELINVMLDWTSVVGTHLDNIKISAKQLEDNRRSLLDYAEYVFKDEDPVRLGTEEMRKKMREFMKSIDDLMQQTYRCSKDIKRARSMVLHEIIQLPE